MTTIAAHALDFPEPEDELEFLEGHLPRLRVNLPRGRDNLGVGFDSAVARLGLRAALGRPVDELVTGMRSVVDWGVALFQRAGVDREQTTALAIDGEVIVVPGGNSYFNSAPRWGVAAGAAMALRDDAALGRLCAFDVAWWGGEYDAWHNAYAEAVMAVIGARAEALDRLDQAAHAAAHARRFPERGRLLGRPLMALARAIEVGDEAGFNQHLAEGLEAWRAVHGRGPDKRDPAGVLPLRTLGWCARAQERGLRCQVVSGYLPAGPWFDPSC
ncbi:MAG: immunity 49 family protein [Myxococcales bacterium]|nr:immunity 49 family protein [Myxococcales bacterium]